MRLRRSASAVLISLPAASSAPRAASYFQWAGTKVFRGAGHSDGVGLFQPAPMPTLSSLPYSCSSVPQQARSAGDGSDIEDLVVQWSAGNQVAQRNAGSALPRRTSGPAFRFAQSALHVLFAARIGFDRLIPASPLCVALHRYLRPR